MPGTTIKLTQQESDQLILSTKRVIIVANTNVFKTTTTIITKQQQKSRVWLDWKNNNFAHALARLFCKFLSHKRGTTIFLEYCPHRSSSLISFLLLLCQMLVVLPLEEVHSSSATFGALLHRPKQVPRH